MVTVSSISTLGQLEILNKSNIPFGLVQLFIANVIPFFVSSSNTFMSSPTEFCIATFPFPLVFVHTEFTLLLFIRRLLGMKGTNWFSPIKQFPLGSTLPAMISATLKFHLRLEISNPGFPSSISSKHHLKNTWKPHKNHPLGYLRQHVSRANSRCFTWIFPFNNFSGVLLSSAFNLTSLTFMDFSGNFPQGTLPNNISGLSYLDLYANLLSGRVPGWLFSLPSLEYLDLSSNKLNGPIDTIPSSFFDFMNLTFLDLSSNNLSGNIKSCMHVKLRNLRSLDLLFNNLPSLTRCSNDVNSTLPMIIEFHFSSCNMHRFASFLNVSKHLQVLDLSNNQIQAEGWEDLVTLNLSMNFLSSVEQIPRKHLFVLDLRSNSLQGPLPTPPQELSYFLISNKELVGEISSKSCNLSFLHSVLDLSKNKLGGTIPDCFGTFSDQLSVIVLRTLIIDFSSNHFKGSIPKKVGELNSLILLNFSHNSLASNIPPSLGKLATLESLDFSSNKIQGRTQCS
ncbi:hypothetical protein GOBAR_AA39319 [Gossypium barbadense]|uniref:Leucine-rich repeat-containing N-terminal plant-type domain-containing protein n=1 Tax=Gossypium barbadense TaxID=3634 RepID=A0A2P5VRC4_GOSBA|nr:hypothetical protein GOBAR_AA39319 [Gossypium barbadense]